MTTLEERRDEELELYAKHYKNPDYRMGVRRVAHVGAILQGLEPKSSYLDLSCGRGESMKMARDAGFTEIYGTEAVEELCGPRPHGLVRQWKAHESLPFDSRSIAHVTCFDVLEHLLEADIVNLLREMQRVAVYTVIVSASSEPSVWEGRDLHISARPEREWLDLITSVWGISTRIEGQAGRSPCFILRKNARN